MWYLLEERNFPLSFIVNQIAKLGFNDIYETRRSYNVHILNYISLTLIYFLEFHRKPVYQNSKEVTFLTVLSEDNIELG